jgi:hypothetical protein
MNNAVGNLDRPSSGGSGSGAGSNRSGGGSSNNNNNVIRLEPIHLNPSTGGGNVITYPVIRLNDFIMHPNGKIIQPHPNDTIMGFKGDMPGGGMSLVIQGDVYGTDPDQIAEALAKRMRQSIRI